VSIVKPRDVYTDVTRVRWLKARLAERAEEMLRLRLPAGIDVFCGCGGFSLGMIQAGFEIVAAIENDPAAAVTYMANLCRFGEYKLIFVDDDARASMERYLIKTYQRSGIVDKNGELIAGKALDKDTWRAGSGWIVNQPKKVRGCSAFIFGDVTKLTGEIILDAIGRDRGDVDCVVGGPPCQGFSVSGKKDPNDPRNNLVFEFIRLVLEIHPKTMCMENVPNIANMTTADGLPILDLVCRALEDGSFATVDMLRRTLAIQAGSFGVMRTSPAAIERKRGKRSKVKLPMPRQVVIEIPAFLPARQSAAKELA
jgi:DNA (cytosine-5)-methyltransferase 1